MAMTYKTVTVDVDVEIDIDEFEDQELIDELEHRGFKCISKDEFDDKQISKQDILVIIGLLDRDVRNWEHRRIFDKLMGPYLSL
jgi:Fe-S cluster biosynthesis and repair protein YggX